MLRSDYSAEGSYRNEEVNALGISDKSKTKTQIYRIIIINYPEYMNIKIIAVGKLKEKYTKDAIEEFKKRLNAYCSLTLTEIQIGRASCRERV